LSSWYPNIWKYLFIATQPVKLLQRLPLHHPVKLPRRLPFQDATSHLWASSNINPPNVPDLHKRYTWFHNFLSYAAYCT
jgi:hypothetical protein